MRNLMRQAIYRIVEDGEVVGTAFAVGSRTIVTAAHLISGTFKCVGPNDQPVSISITKLFEADDLAVLITDCDLPNKLALSSDQPPPTVTTWGYPPIPNVHGMWGIATVSGETSIGGRTRLQLNSDQVTKGFSGAPLVGPNGAVFGMVSSFLGGQAAVEGRLANEAFGVTAEIIIAHLKNSRVEFDLFLPTDERRAQRQAELLCRVQESRARCFARWRAVDLDDHTAREFASDLSIGLFPDVSRTLRTGGLCFVIGDFGTGKSQGLEKTLQQTALHAFEQSSDVSVFYVDARTANPQQLLDPEKLKGEAQRFILFIDNAEALGATALGVLVEGLRGLSSMAPHCTIIVTARPSDCLTGATETLHMPSLSQAEAEALFTKIAPHINVATLGPTRALVLDRPLFVLLAANYVRAGRAMAPSPGDLLAFLAQRVLSRLTPASDNADYVLRRLGSLQTEAGGGLIPVSDVASASERAALLDSGFVTNDQANDSVAFTLPIVAQWFATLALERHEIDLREFTETRLELWRDVFSLRIGVARTADIDELFTVLATHSPGFAASLACGSIPTWYGYRDQPRPSPLEYAARLRAAMGALLLPLGKIAQRSPFANQKGLRGLGARFDESGLRLAWTREQVEPSVFELEPNFSVVNMPPNFQRTAMHRFVDLRPAWNWSLAAREIRDFLQKYFDWSEYATITGAGRQISFSGTAQERELAWQAALGVLGLGSLYPFPIEIRQLEDHPYQSSMIVTSGGRFLQSAPLERVLHQAQKDGITTLLPPWPLPDRDRRGKRMVWEGFSDAAVLERIRVVYSGALEFYRRIVEAVFHRYARRMPLLASMPFDLRVSVFSLPDSDKPALGEWRIIPKTSGENSVIVNRGQPSSPREHQSAYDTAVRIRPELQTYARYLFGQWEIKWYQDYPITELTYEWLREDIKKMFSA
jgi:hypothetical protein